MIDRIEYLFDLCGGYVIKLWKMVFFVYVFWINILYFVLYLFSIVRLVINNWKFVCICCGGKNERLLEMWKFDLVLEFWIGREDDGNWIINLLN